MGVKMISEPRINGKFEFILDFITNKSTEVF